MMNGLAITARGIEGIASIEIKGLINSKTEEKQCAVLFSPTKLEDFCVLSYTSQSISRVLFLLDYFEFKDNVFKLLEEKIKKLDFSKFISKKTTFAVKCQRIGAHDFTSMDVEKKSSEYMIRKINQNKELKSNVDLQNPDIIFYIYIHSNLCYFGIDLCGFDLSKRDYRIFIHPSSLKGNIAYSLLRLGNYKKTDVLLVPFSDSGEIAIEAALFSTEIPVNYYRKDKFAFLNLNLFKGIDFEKFFKKTTKIAKTRTKARINAFSNLLNGVKASQKNAKIAGVNKYINFSKISVNWLDTKLDRHQIDKIITKLPSYSQRLNYKEADKIYAEFFYQADYILKNKGTIGVLLRNKIPKEIPLKYEFSLLKEREIFSGKQKYNVFVYAKKV